MLEEQSFRVGVRFGAISLAGFPLLLLILRQFFVVFPHSLPDFPCVVLPSLCSSHLEGARKSSLPPRPFTPVENIAVGKKSGIFVTSLPCYTITAVWFGRTPAVVVHAQVYLLIVARYICAPPFPSPLPPSTGCPKWS